VSRQDQEGYQLEVENVQLQFIPQEFPPPEMIQSAIIQKEVESVKTTELIRNDGNTLSKNMVKELNLQVIERLEISNHEVKIPIDEIESEVQYKENSSDTSHKKEILASNEKETMGLTKWVKNKKPISCTMDRKGSEKYGVDINKASEIQSAIPIELMKIDVHPALGSMVKIDGQEELKL
jgi:hypothetical protein